MATSADVPGKYDVVINGVGYMFNRPDFDSSSSYLSRHPGEFGYSPTFVERTNVSAGYGDNTQDFWMTVSQKDWSQGEQLKFYRSDQARRYWQGASVDVRTPGQVTMRPAVKSLAFAASVRACSPKGIQTANLYAASATNLYEIDESGTITDRGAHGLGATPNPYGIVTDGKSVYLTANAGGSVGVRKWNGTVFSTFSATTSATLEYLNNTLYGVVDSTSVFQKYDSAGLATTIFQWKEADGTARGGNIALVRAFGGKLLILWSDVARTSELWVYDGNGVSLVAAFPPNFYAYDLEVLFGIAFVSGCYAKGASASSQVRPVVLFYANGNLGELWKADSYMTTTAGVTNMQTANHPSLDTFDGGLVWNDDTTGHIMFYDVGQGGVHAIGSYTVAGDTPLIAASARTLLHTRDQATGYLFPDPSVYATSATIKTALVDFDSSLTKMFRGIVVDFAAATDGDGGSVDIAYQVNGVDGAYTTLKVGATSGTEYTLPSTVTGRSISVQVTLNKGTSTSGPTLKRIYVRAAPFQQSYKQATYRLDCTGKDGKTPIVLRDGTTEPNDGLTLAQALQTARMSTTPISITDPVNGTFTGIIEDVKLVAVRQDEFIAIVTVREV